MSSVSKAILNPIKLTIKTCRMKDLGSCWVSLIKEPGLESHYQHQHPSITPYAPPPIKSSSLREACRTEAMQCLTVSKEYQKSDNLLPLLKGACVSTTNHPIIPLQALRSNLGNLTEVPRKVSHYTVSLFSYNRLRPLGREMCPGPFIGRLYPSHENHRIGTHVQKILIFPRVGSF